MKIFSFFNIKKNEIEKESHFRQQHFVASRRVISVREIEFGFLFNQAKVDCVYHFPIDLEIEILINHKNRFTNCTQ